MIGPLTPEDAPVSPAPDAGDKRGLSALLSTTVGKIVLGVIGFTVIAGLLAAIAFFFFLSRVEQSLEVVVPEAPQQGSATATASGEPVQRRPQRLEDAFIFRNIFRPTVKPAIPATETAESTGTTGAPGAEVPANTLLLQAVSVIDGEERATLVWNGQTYTVGEGDVLGDSPWQVVSIEGNTVVMLFGDSRVTLVVGQGVGK